MGPLFEVETDSNLEGIEVSSSSLTFGLREVGAHVWAPQITYGYTQRLVYVSLWKLLSSPNDNLHREANW